MLLIGVLLMESLPLVFNISPLTGGLHLCTNYWTYYGSFHYLYLFIPHCYIVDLTNISPLVGGLTSCVIYIIHFD